jgi:cell division protein FtsI (penicillin-binding protein 3)
MPQPTDRSWSKISLPWMAFGYRCIFTMQTLAFYNAVVNGEMVKPQFVSEIKKSGIEP